MNTSTGEIRSMEEIAALCESERRNWIPVTRDLTAKEKFDAQIRLYAPCGCGSGKKFKFCCRQKATDAKSQNVPDQTPVFWPLRSE